MPISKIIEASTDSGLYYAKAWVNFNGTGTVAIRASGNVSSITDNGAGDYTVNFTNAMPDTNYVASFGGNGPAVTDYNNIFAYPWQTAPTTGSLRFSIKVCDSATWRDINYIHATFIR